LVNHTAARKAGLAEEAWNSRDPARVALAYTPYGQWRNRAVFVHGRDAIEVFLERKCCGRAATSQPQTRAVAVSERVYFGGRATASVLMIPKPAATPERQRVDANAERYRMPCGRLYL
jgi:Protein of unknown function (DUF1348)